MLRGPPECSSRLFDHCQQGATAGVAKKTGEDQAGNGQKVRDGRRIVSRGTGGPQNRGRQFFNCGWYVAAANGCGQWLRPINS